MSQFKPRFEDIRVIFSIQGYQLSNQFVVREVGYWSPKINGVIQFNTKISASRLDTFSIKNIHILENEFHGIRLKKFIENAMASSDVASVLKCLYQVTKTEGSVADYIGIIRDEKISSIVYKAGLGKYIIELEDMFNFDKPNTTLPNYCNLKYIIGTEMSKYKPCSLHDSLRTSETPICARAKAEIIANYLQQMNAQQQHPKPIIIQSQDSQEVFSYIVQQASV
jgi:hypothetical protein